MFTFPEKQPARLRYALLLPLAMAVLLNGCATTATGDKPEKGLEASENIATGGETGTAPSTKEDGKDETEAPEKDPLEGFNRAMFGFNEKVDTYVAEPITTAYKWITPEFVQTGIANFYANTKTINVVLNDVLQGKLTQSAQDTGRFLVNTTVGVVGLFDVARHMGLEQHEEDFDQTLAVWGVPKGAYLVLPIMGPSTTRGIPGSVVDTAANPVTYVGLPVQVLGMLNARANAEGALKFIDEAALDPYVFTRESFLQWRDYLSADGSANAEAGADEFEDELDAIADTEKDNSSSAEKASGDSAAAKTGDNTFAHAETKNDSMQAPSQLAAQTEQKPTASAALQPVAFGENSYRAADSAMNPLERGARAPW